jgi:hypothetical protein
MVSTHNVRGFGALYDISDGNARRRQLLSDGCPAALQYQSRRGGFQNVGGAYCQTDFRGFAVLGIFEVVLVVVRNTN